MGTWGKKPWDSDGAADWFTDLFTNIDIDAALDEAFRYSDSYDKARSACYLLTVLGHTSYIWPGDLDRLEAHKQRGLKLLRGMAREGSELRELWGDNPELVAELEAEIVALEAVTRTRA